MIIFQNPIHPIKFFEYYSERLKKYYHEPLRNPDLDFLNNIDRNVYDTIKNIYKVPLTFIYVLHLSVRTD